MSKKSAQTMLAENQQARKILAELGALQGAAAQPETSAKKSSVCALLRPRLPGLMPSALRVVL